MTCSTPDCEHPVRIKSRQLCARCYQRHWNAGTLPNLTPKPPRPVPDTLEDLRALDDALAGAVEAAERTGFPTPHAMERWLHRKGHYELWKRLEHRDPLGTHSSKLRRRAS